MAGQDKAEVMVAAPEAAVMMPREIAHILRDDGATLP